MNEATAAGEAVPGDLLPLSRAAKLLPSANGKCLNISTLYRWIRRGKIRGWRIGRHWFCSKADVLAIPKPCDVPLMAEEEAERIKEDQRAEEVDRILRKAGIRR